MQTRFSFWRKMAFRVFAPCVSCAAVLVAIALIGPSAHAAQMTLPSADPSFVPLELAGHVGGLEPVLVVSVAGQTRIYPLRILSLHGVINDEIGDTPLALTYCGPCGAVGAYRRPAGLDLKAHITAQSDSTSMSLAGGDMAWDQESGEPTNGRGRMLKALPAQVLSMAQARQSAEDQTRVSVLRDTAVSRVPTPKTLSLPGSGSSDLTTSLEEEEDTSNQTQVLDARSWSLDLLSPERRLSGEDRLILLQQRQSTLSGPPAPRP